MVTIGVVLVLVGWCMFAWIWAEVQNAGGPAIVSPDDHPGWFWVQVNGALIMGVGACLEIAAILVQ